MPNRQGSNRSAPRKWSRRARFPPPRSNKPGDCRGSQCPRRLRRTGNRGLEADLKVFDSQIADADLKLARTDVKTPVAGTVSAKNAKVGAIAAGNGDPLFTIIRDGDIELVAEVAESDVVRIMAGQRLRFRCPAAVTSFPVPYAWFRRPSIRSPALASSISPSMTTARRVPACMAAPRSSCARLKA